MNLPAELSDGMNDMPELDGAGGDLRQHGSKEEKIFTAYDADFQRIVPCKGFFKNLDHRQRCEPSTENHEVLSLGFHVEVALQTNKIG